MTNLVFIKIRQNAILWEKEAAEMKKQAGLILFLAAAMLPGCRAEMTENNLSQLHFVKYEDMEGEKSPEERAVAIKRRIYQIEEVTGCAVVVEGHTAIIGLRLKENMEQNDQKKKKKETDAAAKEADELIESTSITMNTYIVSLIEDMERKRAG